MMPKPRPGWRLLKMALAWAFWAGNLAVILWFWASGSSGELLSGGSLPLKLLAFARLLGLLATFCALTQFVLMGRVGWLEPTFGLDRLALFHRLNGFTTITLILLHSSLMVLSYSMLSGQPALLETINLLGMPFVLLAFIAELLFILTVILSIYIVRKHLRFETWYAVHLFNYAAIALIPWHQLTNGGDFSNSAFSLYWVCLYLFVALNLLWWRFIKPVARSAFFGFTVEKIVPETSNSTSVYINYKRGSFKALGGQFVMVRFLARPFFWQEHPFSLSMLPNSRQIRLTIRHIGDFSGQVHNLKLGTPVLVSGPHGAFTHLKRRTQKILYIAGGIGITPIRAMIEEQVKSTKQPDSILLYANRTLEDAALTGELERLSQAIRLPFYNILSDSPGYKGEKGFIDQEKISRLVPDVAQRDVFLCGPPPMMAILHQTLRELGVPNNQIHYERFRLHKKD